VADKFTQMTAELYRYAVEHSDGRDELLQQLAAETEREAGEVAIMQTAPEQAALMTVLVRAIGARRALELGTFTGYGSISIARGLPDDGILVTCEVSEQWAQIARGYFERAGLEDRIELRMGPALETLRALPESEPFDFAFIDADKENYPAYYEECLRLLCPGGLLLLDNVFRGGSIIEGTGQDEDLRSLFGDEDERLRATREVNERVATDERVISAMVGIADGVTFAVKL
jgi:caffeoyl-CoA O-methyltransferase